MVGPRGLKPQLFLRIYGTAEAVPSRCGDGGIAVPARRRFLFIGVVKTDVCDVGTSVWVGFESDSRPFGRRVRHLKRLAAAILRFCGTTKVVPFPQKRFPAIGIISFGSNNSFFAQPHPVR